MHKCSYNSFIIDKEYTIHHEECWWGAHLPYLGLQPAGG